MLSPTESKFLPPLRKFLEPPGVQNKVARWWQILPKITVFHKICQLLLATFYAKFLLFLNYQLPVSAKQSILDYLSIQNLK